MMQRRIVSLLEWVDEVGWYEKTCCPWCGVCTWGDVLPDCADQPSIIRRNLYPFFPRWNSGCARGLLPSRFRFVLKRLRLLSVGVCGTCSATEQLEECILVKLSKADIFFCECDPVLGNVGHYSFVEMVALWETVCEGKSDCVCAWDHFVEKKKKKEKNERLSYGAETGEKMTLVLFLQNLYGYIYIYIPSFPNHQWEQLF